MKQCVSYGLILLASLILSGCASQPTLDGRTAIVSTGPEIRLPGKGAEHAQLLAMGMARSKGWQITEVDDHRLVLERNLPPASPQAQKLSAEGMLSTPKLQVESRFQEHANTVKVGLSAYVITNPGTDAERRIDYTSDYESALLISLNALANAWMENRQRIASEIPLPPDPDQVVIAASGADDRPNTRSPDPTDASRQRLAGSSTEPTAAQRSQARSNAEQPASDAQPSAATSVALQQPELLRPRSRIRTQYVPPSTTVENEMLALESVSSRGLWSSYAEASARERGCEIGQRGAVLLNVAPTFELYEVQCTNRPRMLLSCQGGICRINR